MDYLQYLTTGLGGTLASGLFWQWTISGPPNALWRNIINSACKGSTILSNWTVCFLSLFHSHCTKWLLVDVQKKVKRKNPIHNTPHNINVIKKTKETEDDSQIECLISDKVILEPGDKAVFCEGDCQGWIHRQCAGITHPVLEKLSSESTPYLCPHCILSKQNNEISTIKETIKTVNDKINKLEGKRTEAVHQQPILSDNKLPGPLNQPKAPLVNQQRSSDRKCNVVFYGNKECPPSTPKPVWSQSDLKSILSAVPNIKASAIKDLHRLGKFKPGQQRPRPLLVKFLRALDAQAVLFDRSFSSYTCQAWYESWRKKYWIPFT